MSKFNYSMIILFLYLFVSLPAQAQGVDEKLRLACANGEYDVIEKAIKKSKIDVAGNDGNELLMIASKTGNYVIVNILLDAGADVNSADNLGRTPLQAAIAYDQPKVVEALMQKGANKESEISKRDFDCVGYDNLNLGMTYKQVKELIGDLGLSMLYVMQNDNFEVEKSNDEKYNFRNGKLSYWRHPCKKK